MADLMTALRNAHNAGDTEAATRIAAMIKAQGASNGPTATQEAPQQAQPVSQPTTQPTPSEPATEPQSALERGFNAVGDVAATGGRLIAGGVAGLANAGIGVVNTIGQGVQQASNAITGENGQYQPIAPAGYGEYDKYLMPRGTGEKIAAEAIPYIAGGELVAPVKAAENAGRFTRAATAFANQIPASVMGAVSKYNQGDQSGDALADIAINSIGGATLEKVGGAVIKGARNLLPESLGGFTQAEKAAAVANPDYVNSVLQGGNQDAQAAFRTATTDANGNSILTPAQTLNTQAGRKYIAAEQRDLTRGTDSAYQARYDAQKAGDSLTQAVNDTLTGGDQSLLQQAAQDTTGAFKQRAKELYNESKQGAQDILNSAPVKITELKMPQTKQIAINHLAENASTGNIKLTSEARRTLNAFTKDSNKIKTIDDLDTWKRQLNEKAQKAFRSGDMTSYNALKEVSTSLKGEADNVISTIDPRAGSLYQDADKFYSHSVGDFGDKSVIGKIAGKDNPDLAANALIRGQNAEFNTQQVVTALQDAINRGDIPAAQQLSQQLGQGLGEATRAEALRAATTGENFSATKFANTLSRLEPQAAAANTMGATGQAEVNQALADSIRAMRERASVPQTNGLVAQAAGRVVGGKIGGGLGFTIGGPVGAGAGIAAGQKVGGEITSAINQGLLDRLAGTVKRGNDYVNYLADPANAKAVSDILASRGASFDTATAKEVKGVIDGLMKPYVSNSLESQANESQTVTPSQPTSQAEAPATIPEPEPVATEEPKRGKAMRLYKSLAAAETGGLDNRYIRTKAAEAGPSTAYGPAQITVSLADTFRKRKDMNFTDAEKDYLNRFSEQGHKMLKASANDPVYGYGGTGELTSPEDQKLYARVAIKMLDKMIEDNNGSLDKTVKQWRGADDKNYFAKVRTAFKANAPTRKIQGWSRNNAN